MRKCWLLAAVVVLAACGGDDAVMPVETEIPGVVVENAVPVDVAEVGGSGVSGSARVSRSDEESAVVELDVDGAEAADGAVHRGGCDDLGERAYDLTGRRTPIPASMQTLTNAPHAIAVHLDGEVVACGAIS